MSATVEGLLEAGPLYLLALLMAFWNWKDNRDPDD